MNDDIEQIRENFPNPQHGKKRGKIRPRVTFVLSDDIKRQAVDTAADLLNQSYGEELGYPINRNHVVNHMIATHPLTADIEHELREQEES